MENVKEKVVMTKIEIDIPVDIFQKLKEISDVVDVPFEDVVNASMLCGFDEFGHVLKYLKWPEKDRQITKGYWHEKVQWDSEKAKDINLIEDHFNQFYPDSWYDNPEHKHHEFVKFHDELTYYTRSRYSSALRKINDEEQTIRASLEKKEILQDEFDHKLSELTNEKRKLLPVREPCGMLYEWSDKDKVPLNGIVSTAIRCNSNMVYRVNSHYLCGDVGAVVGARNKEAAKYTALEGVFDDYYNIEKNTYDNLDKLLEELEKAISPWNS